MGEMVIGYGELDITFSMICGIALGHKWAVLDACHKIRAETQRLDVADALAKESFEQLGMKEDYDRSLSQMKICLKIRNQYAHSQWGEFEGVLKFLNPDSAFERPLKPAVWKSVSAALLLEQADYFENTRLWLIFLEMEIEAKRTGKPSGLRKPLKRHVPNPHNPMPTPGRIPKGKGSRAQQK